MQRLAVKIWCSVFAALFLCTACFAQEAGKSAEQISVSMHDCGNSLIESQIYGYRFGKVVWIMKDNKIVVAVTNSSNDQGADYVKNTDGPNGRLLKRPQTFVVSLVGIDPSTNRAEVSRFLQKHLLGENVTIVGNLQGAEKDKLEALVRFDNGDELEEVSEYLLRNGLAKYEPFQLTNLVPMSTACELERAQAEAQQNKIGIWVKTKLTPGK